MMMYSTSKEKGSCNSIMTNKTQALKTSLKSNL